MSPCNLGVGHSQPTSSVFNAVEFVYPNLAYETTSGSTDELQDKVSFEPEEQALIKTTM